MSEKKSSKKKKKITMSEILKNKTKKSSDSFIPSK